MPLQPAEQASLALWLCAARYLDSECYAAEDPGGLDLLKAARGTLEGAAAGTRLSVSRCQDFTSYLITQAERLAALPRHSAGMDVIAMLDNAERQLRLSVEDSTPNEAGDGPADATTIGAPCSRGVRGFAAVVEARVRQLLVEQVGLPLNADPVITYVTALTEDGQDFTPFCIDGNASIRRQPRTVTIVLRAQPLTSRDLWHIAYTLHHELICHIFQGALAEKDKRLPDAHPNCHWSEGWMDTLAFDLVSEWNNPPHSWLPLTGEEAVGALRRFHDHRYETPPRLSPDDVKRRRLARAAYRQLPKILLNYGLATSTDEARDITRRFSLMANTHREAECGRLKTLGAKLRMLLLSTARPQAGVAAAAACLAFTVQPDLAKLEREIDAISG